MAATAADRLRQSAARIHEAAGVAAATGGAVPWARIKEIFSPRRWRRTLLTRTTARDAAEDVKEIDRLLGDQPDRLAKDAQKAAMDRFVVLCARDAALSPASLRHVQGVPEPMRRALAAAWGHEPEDLVMARFGTAKYKVFCAGEKYSRRGPRGTALAQRATPPPPQEPPSYTVAVRSTFVHFGGASADLPDDLHCAAGLLFVSEAKASQFVGPPYWESQWLYTSQDYAYPLAAHSDPGVFLERGQLGAVGGELFQWPLCCANAASAPDEVWSPPPSPSLLGGGLWGYEDGAQPWVYVEPPTAAALAPPANPQAAMW